MVLLGKANGLRRPHKEMAPLGAIPVFSLCPNRGHGGGDNTDHSHRHTGHPNDADIADRY
jgi:hypothetical protein